VTSQAQIMDLMLELTDERGTAVMLITHDLGVVAGFCDDVQVMYGGGIVEKGTAGEIFYHPKHPYTFGLLGSMARLDDAKADRLASIRGTPPSLIQLPKGCRFRPRCDFAQEQCLDTLPLLHPIEDEHEAACHFAGEIQFEALAAEEVR